jgi:hypothetical protein
LHNRNEVKQSSIEKAPATACAQNSDLLGKRLFRTRKMRKRSTSSTINQEKLVKRNSLYPDEHQNSYWRESTRNTTIFNSSIPSTLTAQQNGISASVGINIKTVINT